METIKIRNFYGARFFQKIKKIKQIISNISYRFPFYNKLDFEEIPVTLNFLPPNFWKGDIEKGEIFLNNKNFFVQNEDKDLFFYNHSFSWLTDLKNFGKEGVRIKSRELTKKWIDNNNSWNSATWSDYILSSRLCSWIHNYDFFFSIQ